MKTTRLTEAQLRKAIREEIATVMDGPAPAESDKRLDIREELVNAVMEPLLNYISSEAATADEDAAFSIAHEFVHTHIDALVTDLAEHGYIV